MQALIDQLEPVKSRPRADGSRRAPKGAPKGLQKGSKRAPKGSKDPSGLEKAMAQ